jgi:hypothetical protein
MNNNIGWRPRKPVLSTIVSWRTPGGEGSTCLWPGLPFSPYKRRPHIPGRERTGSWRGVRHWSAFKGSVRYASLAPYEDLCRGMVVVRKRTPSIPECCTGPGALPPGGAWRSPTRPLSRLSSLTWSGTARCSVALLAQAPISHRP